jgi:hypothetical protein
MSTIPAQTTKAVLRLLGTAQALTADAALILRDVNETEAAARISDLATRLEDEATAIGERIAASPPPAVP